MEILWNQEGSDSRGDHEGLALLDMNPPSHVQIINYNLDLVSMSQMGQELAKAAAAPGELGPVGGVDLGRSLRLWLSLQNSLNGLFDSTTAEGGSDGNQV